MIIINIKQRKNIIEISRLITDMSHRGATEREIDRVLVYLDDVMNNKLEFDNIKSLGCINDLVTKYRFSFQSRNNNMFYNEEGDNYEKKNI